MSVSISSWLVILLALLVANVPFFNQQLFAFLRLSKADNYRKPIWMRLLELLVFYILLGVTGRLMEAQAGNVFVQTWEFFAITACLFLVFAFPGFVFQYLRKHQA
ncbi:DUF2818 family protein [Herbaspirillum sp. RTI4]|uniref:DUF2818 family protein n=1 Tax=Herbaspirillum sp. RTI4 TaxID=3048640 RepID=UPI002AB41E27|nr:DUF2818 family protein [Herbaspirillum sp. RTI4]MDY7578529.1 DUF2818 family protein [Herbaspirillum sp. RTI4]MEA9981442.1 DUF2818 family protein [Herbaspirillum sp. RTI4]